MFARIAPGESLAPPLDAALPGGMIEGHGDFRHGRTMAFHVLVLYQSVDAVCLRDRRVRERRRRRDRPRG